MTQHQTNGSPPDADIAKDYKPYTTEHYGVWDVLLMKEGASEAYRRLIGDLPNSIPYFSQLIQDIYALSPFLFVLFVFSELWTGCQEALNMHFSSKILRIVSIITSSLTFLPG